MLKTRKTFFIAVHILFVFTCCVFTGCDTNELDSVVGDVKIRFGIVHESTVNLTIENSYNTTVRTLFDNQPLGVGYHEVSWDMKDENGDSVPEGVYYYRLTVRGNDEPQIFVRAIIARR